MTILICGEDHFLTKEKLAFLKKEFLKKYEKIGASVLILESEDLSLEDLKQAVLGVSLFSSRRLIIIKNLSESDISLSEIAEIIKIKPEEHAVIFYEEKNSDDLEKFIKKTTPKIKYELAPLKGKDLEVRVSAELKNAGLGTSHSYVSRLIELLGNDLFRLLHEINKLAAQTRNAPPKLEEIGKLVNKSEEASIFSFIEKFSEKKKDEALVMLSSKLDEGESAEQILGLIIRQIRILLIAKTELGVAGTNFLYKLGLPSFVVQKIRRQTEGFSVEGLKEMYNKLLQLDTRIKTGVAKPESLLAFLVGS